MSRRLSCTPDSSDLMRTCGAPGNGSCAAPPRAPGATAARGPSVVSLVFRLIGIFAARKADWQSSHPKLEASTAPQGIFVLVLEVTKTHRRRRGGAQRNTNLKFQVR